MAEPQSKPYLVQPASPGPLTPEQVRRFWLKVEKTDGCWLWRGCLSSNRYGRAYVGPKRCGYPAHRVAYELVRGPIPDGLPLDHLCRTPRCVNPDHLEPVTHRENMLRGVSPMALKAHQTHCKHGHELTEENTIRRPSRPVSRECRACFNARQRETWRQGKRKRGLNG